MEAATRVFDSIQERVADGGLSAQGYGSRNSHPLFKTGARNISRWKMLLRLAALVHDTGHSVFSHSSERIYGLIDPFPDLIRNLRTGNSKSPGAAEVMVYLLVTSSAWKSTIDSIWPSGPRVPAPPSSDEWERIGRWVMGQEEDRQLKFLADIISGPLDADKLDYVFRDGYASGIPVGYDLERLISTVCVDPQPAADRGKPWWRLTLPVRGINALEQLVMGRLVLNSYLYHHHKCRSAEAAFERALAREYLKDKTVAGRRRVWDLFTLQDADAYSYAKTRTACAREIRALYRRRLRVRVVEFRRSDIEASSQRVAFGFTQLMEFASIKNWDAYQALLRIEDRIAKRAALPKGAVILDVPKYPDYADLENLLLPGRKGESGEEPSKVLNYRDWIAAYKVSRSFVRVFAPRGKAVESAVWKAAGEVFKTEFDLELPLTARAQTR